MSPASSVKLSDYRGKSVVLNFWATLVRSPCKVEIPWFIDFEKQYKDRDFDVVGVSMDDDGWKSVTPYVSDKKIVTPRGDWQRRSDHPLRWSGLPADHVHYRPRRKGRLGSHRPGEQVHLSG